MQTYRIEYILQGKVGRHFHAYSAHVQPKMFFTDSASSYVNELHLSPGNFSMCANTQVSGESSTSSQGCGTVTVRKK